MNKYSVFNGLNTSEKVGLYKALDADERTFKKSETILSFSPESYEKLMFRNAMRLFDIKIDKCPNQ